MTPLSQTLRSRWLCLTHQWVSAPRQGYQLPGGLELLTRSPLPEPNEIASLLLLLYNLDCKFFPDLTLWL